MRFGIICGQSARAAMKNSPIPHSGIAVVTALKEEFTACRAVFGGTRGTIDRKLKLTISTANLKIGSSLQSVTIAMLPGPGNNLSAICADRLLRKPGIKHVIMCGIAGGAPNPENPDRHVRLGDIVAVGPSGIVQYDFDKESRHGKIHPRNPPRPPSMLFANVVKHLLAEELENRRPWEKLIARGTKKLGTQWKRPSKSFDILYKWLSLRRKINHPPRDRPGKSRVFEGTIASANKLLKNPAKRDKLRETYGVLAVEMEGSGVADASLMNESSYYVVRGVCDYCDPAKGDHWHNYAAIVAAAFVRTIIENYPTTKRITPKTLFSNRSSSVASASKWIIYCALHLHQVKWRKHPNNLSFYNPAANANLVLDFNRSAGRLQAAWIKNLGHSTAARVSCKLKHKGRTVKEYFLAAFRGSHLLVPLPTGYPQPFLSADEYSLYKILNPNLTDDSLRKYLADAKIIVRNP